MILLIKGEPLAGKELPEPICPSLFLNPFPPRAAKSGHFVILLCLTPDDCTHQRKTSGWEKVNITMVSRQYTLYYTFIHSFQVKKK